MRQIDGQYELFMQVDKTVRQNLQNLVMQDARNLDVESTSESLLAGAIAMALCYIHRQVPSLLHKSLHKLVILYKQTCL